MFNFSIIVDDQTIKAGDKENAQKITNLLFDDYKIEMTLPNNKVMTFSGLNAWYEVSQIMGPNAE